MGEGDPRPALDAITQDAREEGQPLRLIALTQYHKNWLEANYPDRFAFEEARDGFDYLYDIDRLADLPGKKLHAKRNHIHRLDEAYPGWDWTPMTQADIAPCLAMDAAWHQEALTREAAEGGLSTLDDEHRALVLALENREALGLDGIVTAISTSFTISIGRRRSWASPWAPSLRRTSSTCTSSGPEGTFKGPTRR